jgi:translation initiation factor 2 alpha subunit (eIF-2alpha)|tara:strand:- start:919 stop:1626 length:708 start_codon:yes stop_codon:yes gene_type:complete
MELESGELVLCTVERIEKIIVFVRLDNGLEGSIIISEIAPGRIRNIRNYVVPKKKIVCKILRISQSGNIELSLRRVTPKEKKEVMEEYKQEKSYVKIIGSVLGEKSKDVIESITKKERLYDFINEGKKDSKKIEEVFGKEDSKKILDILLSQKQKKAVIKKEISLISYDSNGLELIKNVLEKIKGARTRYISAGKYSIIVESEDMKNADKKSKDILNGIEEDSKKQGVLFEFKEK